MSNLAKRLAALETDARARYDADLFEIIKENGFEKGLAILEEMGRHTEAQAIRQVYAEARVWLIEWERVTFGNSDAIEKFWRAEDAARAANQNTEGRKTEC
jgi:hypothetical protein